jgi:hypothetical protein
MANAAFSKKKSFQKQTAIKYSYTEELVKCYIWRIGLYIFQTLRLRKVDHKYLKSLDMCCWRRMEKIS